MFEFWTSSSCTPHPFYQIGGRIKVWDSDISFDVCTWIFPTCWHGSIGLGDFGCPLKSSRIGSVSTFPCYRVREGGRKTKIKLKCSLMSVSCHEIHLNLTWKFDWHVSIMSMMKALLPSLPSSLKVLSQMMQSLDSFSTMAQCTKFLKFNGFNLEFVQ